MRKYSNYVISFEGLPGSGKTTLSKMLSGELISKGVSVEYVKPLKRKKIEGTLSFFGSPSYKLWINTIPLVEPEVAIPIFASIVRSEIPAKDKGVIITDRHLDSVFAFLYAFYNLRGFGMALKDFHRLFYDIGWRIVPKPYLTILLRYNAPVLKRVETDKKDNIDEELEEQLRLVEKAYDFLAQTEERIVVVESDSSPLITYKKMMEKAGDRLERLLKKREKKE